MSTKTERRRELILNGSVYKAILIIALPVALSGAMGMIFKIMDSYFAQMIGKNELSAVSLVTPLMNIASAIGAGISVAATTMIARNVAKKEMDDARKVLGQAISLSLIMSLLVIGVGFVLAGPIISGSGGDASFYDVAMLYFTISLLDIPLKYLNLIYQGTKSGTGRSGIIFTFSGIQIVVKFLLTYLFISVLDLGIIGLVYATIGAEIAISAIAFYDIFINKNNEIGTTVKNLIPSKKIIFVILAISFPIMIERSLLSFGHLSLNKMAKFYSNDVFNAYSQTNLVTSLPMNMIGGFTTATTAIIAQNSAVGNFNRLKEAIKKSMLMACIFGAFMNLGTILLAGVFAKNLSAGDADIAMHMKQGLTIFSFTLVFWALFQVCVGVFQGLQKNIYTMVISNLRLWVFRVGLIAILVYVLSLPVVWLWIGMLTSNVVGALMSLVCMIFVVRAYIAKNTTVESVSK